MYIYICIYIYIYIYIMRRDQLPSELNLHFLRFFLQPFCRGDSPQTLLMENPGLQLPPLPPKAEIWPLKSGDGLTRRNLGEIMVFYSDIYL